jgi:hypothetical protein
MKFAIKTVAQADNAQPGNRDATLYVRKGWAAYGGYYVVSSIAVGIGVTAAMLLFAVFDHSKRSKSRPLPAHAPLLFLSTVAGALSAVVFLVQLASGPFVFTKDVVCRKCRIRQQAKRVAFFSGPYSRTPKCACGGKLEPAILWKPEGSGSRLYA